MDRDTLLTVVIALSVVGLAVAGYQSYEHYTGVQSEICDIGEEFSCSVVTESKYGEFPKDSGIALSLWGFLWWISVIFLAGATLKGREILPMQEFALFADILFGVLTAFYLIAVEIYFLPQITGEIIICPLCTVQHALILMLVPVGYALLSKPFSVYLEEIFYREGDDG